MTLTPPAEVATRVEQFVYHEQQADEYGRLHDAHRWEAARLAYEEVVVEGTSTRSQLAAAIGKSAKHVGLLVEVYKIKKMNPGSEKRSFNEVYQAVKAPEPKPELATAPQATAEVVRDDPPEPEPEQLSELADQIRANIDAYTAENAKQLAFGIGPGHLAMHHRRIRDEVNDMFDPEIQDALWRIMWAPEADALAATMVALKDIKWSLEDDEGRQWLTAWAEARPEEHRQALAEWREAQDE